MESKYRNAQTEMNELLHDIVEDDFFESFYFGEVLATAAVSLVMTGTTSIAV